MHIDRIQYERLRRTDGRWRNVQCKGEQNMVRSGQTPPLVAGVDERTCDVDVMSVAGLMAEMKSARRDEVRKERRRGE